MKKTAFLIWVISVLMITGCSQYQTKTTLPTTTTTTSPTTTTTTPPVTKPTPTPTTNGVMSKNITIENFQFSPASVQISAGGTVHRKNNDNVSHQIAADDGSFQSTPLQPGDSFSFTFAQAGTFAYHCTIHPSMHGTLVVK